jgi:Protein of unknown function (DUF1524)
MWLRALVLAVVAAVALGAATAPSRSAPTPSSSVPRWIRTAVNRLAKLPVEPAGTMTGYSRAKFGPAWQDVDHNGCNTRDDILRRDLKPFTLKPGSKCIVIGGDLDDPYTGKIIHFARGAATSTAVQIDHVVALAAAWRTGAANWRARRRLVYANDPDVLLAVDGPANNEKRDSDASEWVSPKYSCRYVAQQLAIKKKYTLWLTQAEHDRMAALLESC